MRVCKYGYFDCSNGNSSSISARVQKTVELDICTKTVIYDIEQYITIAWMWAVLRYRGKYLQTKA